MSIPIFRENEKIALIFVACFFGLFLFIFFFFLVMHTNGSTSAVLYLSNTVSQSACLCQSKYDASLLEFLI